MNISVAGIGYVGLSLSVLLAQTHQVCAFDPVKRKTDMVNAGKSPIVDRMISEYLSSKIERPPRRTKKRPIRMPIW